MSSLTPTNSAIVASFAERTPGSAALHARASALLPSGIVHDSRRSEPYPIYVGRAAGPRKWDVDGRELVDFYGGHGALLLGHCHPAVTEAVRRQLELGTHPAACHEGEIEWAALLQEMVPCAERVRFTASGTEATHMAVRLARAHTGRPKIMRFHRHFHGWHDHMAFGVDGHFDGSPSPGILPEVAAEVVLLPPGDLQAVERAFERDDGIAAVILEPTGASTGVVPLDPSFVRGLREATRRHGTLLVFDEVVTGFRVDPGGAQRMLGVTPDLCTLAKVLAGGLPGGAVAGRKEVIDWLDFDVAAARRREKIPHQGTYNANPVSAAAGVAALRLVRDTDLCGRANAAAAGLRHALNRVLAEEGVAWAVYGEHSVLHFFTNPRGLDVDPLRWDANRQPPEVFAADPRKTLLQKLYLALVVHGIDPKGSRGAIVSAVHGQAEIDAAADAWRRALRMLKDEGELRH